LKAISLYTKSHAIHFTRWTNTSFAVFRSIGKQVVIGVITGLLERLNSVKSTVINYIENPEKDLQSPGNEQDWWDELIAEDGLQTNLLSCITIDPGSSELSHSGFNQTFSYLKCLFVALIGLFLFLPFLKGSASFSFSSFYYFKSFSHE
jgi:hypothetical protein